MNFDSNSSSNSSQVIDKILKTQSQKTEKLYGEYEEQFEFQRKQKKFQQMTFLMGCLKNHFIFYNLSSSQLENVAKKMYYCFVPNDNFLFREGSKSNWFFIIEKGMMHIIHQGKSTKQLRVGDGFGEIALLYKTKRTYSVKTSQSCFLWAIDRNTFRKAVEEIIIAQYEENKVFMENVRFFRCLSNDHKDTVAGSLITHNFSKGQMLVSEGDPGSSYFVIKQGVASVWKGNNFVGELKRGDCFGQQSLYYNTVRKMSVKSQGDLTCLILSRQTLSKVLGDQIFIVTFRNFIRWSIEKSAYLSKLNKQEIQRIIDLMKINTHKAGSIVIKRSKLGTLPSTQKIIVVIEGAIKRSKNIHPIAIRSHVYGEEFLLETKNKGRYDDDIIMCSNGVLAEINADLIINILKGKLDIVIRHRGNLQQQKIKLSILRRKKKFIKGIDSLVLIKELKHSSFGPNLLVACPEEPMSNCNLYLLKCVQKSKVESHILYKCISNEIDLLKNIHHPLIIEGYKFFDDKTLFCSLVEFIQGEELYEAIREIGLLSTKDAQFYTACIILIIEHLKDNKIYLRDLKPQNFIVDMLGYPMLIDMVSAKVEKDKGVNNKTFTMIGTPHYMAPQIIMNRGYNFYVCLYSLGIMLYEFLCGSVPFGQNNEDPLQVYEDVLNLQLKFPKSLKDCKAQKLIKQLLSRQCPQSRLGGGLDFNCLKNNHWFESIDWTALYERRVQAPRFNRNPNVKLAPQELIKLSKHAKNCSGYLEQKFPTRQIDEDINSDEIK